VSLDFRPQGDNKLANVQTVGQHIQSEAHLEKFDEFGVEPILH
jgi:hypothetical protein